MKKEMFIVLVFLISLTISCTKENAFEHSSNSKREIARIDCLLELNYEVETTTLFAADKASEYSLLDLAAMAPSRERQSVKMGLLRNGEMFMEVSKMKPIDPIIVPHQFLPDNSPKVQRVLVASNLATVYDENGKVISSIPLELPNNIRLVQSLQESAMENSEQAINDAIASMQGVGMNGLLNDYWGNLNKEGLSVIDDDGQHITISASLSSIDTRTNQEAVVIIDKMNKRLVACRIYNKDEVLITTLMGYGPPKKPYLAAIKQISHMPLPSGRNVRVETLMKIDGIKIVSNL